MRGFGAFMMHSKTAEICFDLEQPLRVFHFRPLPQENRAARGVKTKEAANRGGLTSVRVAAFFALIKQSLLLTNAQNGASAIVANIAFRQFSGFCDVVTR